ncbi:MAG: hypothetical protein ACYCV7_11975 [Acidimicrobiales bacterium]
MAIRGSDRGPGFAGTTQSRVRGLRSFLMGASVPVDALESEGASGGVVQMATAPYLSFAALGALQRFRHEVKAEPELFRSVVGPGYPGEAYLLTVWRGHRGAQGLFGSPAPADMDVRWAGCCRAGDRIPENALDNWDGTRARPCRRME